MLLALGVSGQELVKLCVLQGASDQVIPRWRHTWPGTGLDVPVSVQVASAKRKAQREEGTSNQESECETQRIVLLFLMRWFILHPRQTTCNLELRLPSSSAPG